MTSPYSVIPLPSLEEKPHVTADEARAIWLEANKTHVRMLIMTLWFTGLRISEALSLKSSSVMREGWDFTLNVFRQKKPKKSAKPERLPIPREYGLELLDYIKSRGLKGVDRLFPASRSTYWRQIQRCAQKAGLAQWKEIHPHSFRHGFVYDKAKKGVHPYILSKLSGHSQLRTTLSYYQPSEDDLRKAMEA